MDPTLPIVFTILIIAGTAALLVQMYRLGGQRLPDGTGRVPGSLEEVKQHFVYGAFYMNPDDPRGWVPKASGYGKAVNFRTRRQVNIFVATIIGTLLSSVGLTLSVLL